MIITNDPSAFPISLLWCSMILELGAINDSLQSFVPLMFSGVLLSFYINMR